MTTDSPFQKIRNLLISVFVFLTLLAVFVPFLPHLPSSGLDPSWQFAINQAVAQGLIFGKDVIFTFGPYTSLYTKMYHPATDQLMLWGSLFLGSCYACLLLLLARGAKFPWLIVYAFFAVGFIFTQDSLLLSYPLILILATYRQTLPNVSFPLKNGFLLFFLPLGLLPLIKGSLIPMCILAMTFCFVLFWHNKQKRFASLAIALPLFALVSFWLLSGQPLSALPIYFINLSDIISGYTEAMTVIGNKNEFIFYIFASIFILYFILSTKFETITRKLTIIISFSLFLFVSFKAAFIRHDTHAAAIAAPSIVMAALLVNFIAKNKAAWMAIPLSLMTWGYIDQGHLKTSTEVIYNKTLKAYSDVWTGSLLRLSKKTELRKNFKNRLKAIQQERCIPKLEGTVDIYSFEQSSLLSTKNTFSPRPIIQSYSAYTPKLAQLNEAFLRSKNAPDHLLFRIEPIDNRFPALEDGLSWPTIIKNYSAEKNVNDLVYLKKRKSFRNDLIEREIYQSEHKLNEVVVLPEKHGLLFVKLHISKTLYGHISSILFKPSQLSITINCKDGNKRRYRLISTMAKSKFLISPLVENTSDFFSLIKSGAESLQEKSVKSIQIHGKRSVWEKYYTLKISELSEES